MKTKALLAITVFASAPDPSSSIRQNPPQPRYEIRLDEREPMIARFTLTLSATGEQRLSAAPEAAQAIVKRPHCGGQPLRQVAATTWLKPEGCLKIRWSARLVDHDAAGVDATDPLGAWSARHRLWIVTGRLPWLHITDQADATAYLDARLVSGETRSQHQMVSPGRGAPTYLVVGAGAVQRHGDDDFKILIRGDAPAGPRIDELHDQVARTWARWRRDILPPGATTADRLDIVWVKPPAGLDPGFYAATGSHAILMQYLPDPAAADPEVKLRAGVLLIGVHEGFHVLFGGVTDAGAEWMGESLASYFAYDAARRYLTGAELALADDLVGTPARQSLLDAQRALDSGNQAAVMAFYGKGARFWTAIEAVLDSRGNESGKLAALIRKTNGMRGIDWFDPNSVAEFLDRHSGGKAGPIVRCYLVAQDCP